MLSLLIAHIVITILCFISGMVFYNFFSKANDSRPLIFYLISGLVFLTAVTQILVLVFPIGPPLQLFIFGLLLAPLLFKWRTYKIIFNKTLKDLNAWPALSYVLFIVAWMIILLMNAGPTIMDDTESYHIQSIKWIREYGSVPGLVNLHERFGFNSSWFSSVALFSFLPGTTGGFTVLNSILSMWLCYWFISTYTEQQKKKNAAAACAILAVFITCLVIWPLVRGNAATTNYDFITTFIVLILFTEIFLAKDFSPSIEWIIWPAYLFTVRIINFPLLILGLIAVVMYIRQRKFKVLFLPLAYCLLLTIPFIIRNIIISGYPFYPSMSFDLINIDWKPDPQKTLELLEYIKYFNRVFTTYLEIEQTKALGSNWVPSWFKYLFLFDKALIVLGAAGIVLSIVKLFRTKNRAMILLMAISVAWIICWFLIAPDPRFVYGVLLFGIFQLIYTIISIIQNLKLLNIMSNVLLLVMITGSSYYFVSKLWKQKDYRNWIVPAQLPRPPVKEVLIDGFKYRIPEQINDNWNARCYGTGLPCLYKIDPRLRPRGKNMADGFRLEK